MRSLVGVFALVAMASAASVSLVDLEFHSWKLKHSKSYSSVDEESQRKMIWLTNRKLVIEHNILADQGLRSYRLGMTIFADMDDQEYNAIFSRCLESFNDTKTRSADTFNQQARSADLPNTVDWRTEGLVTAVKNQVTCASCWAFSVTGALEAQMVKETGKLVSLSEQQLVDCSSSYGNNGCRGGTMAKAFNYIGSNKGLQSEDSYPYENAEGKCMFNPQKVIATCSKAVQLTPNDEMVLQTAVARKGPISAGIDISRYTFKLYESGVYDEPFCSSSDLNHAVLVVGYSTDEKGEEYWLVKNSWGIHWGEEGYIKIARNKNNMCGVAKYAFYPVI